MDKNLSELQLKMLRMMKWFHQYCLDNGITYYMLGGTMLGAARHQGYIPWDDDMDVGIPRKDYDKLLQISKDLIYNNSQYIIESYIDGNKDYQYVNAKLYDTSTTLIENRRTQPKRGIFVDIFPLDGIAGDSFDEVVKNYKPINRKLDLIAARTCEVRKGRSLWKNIIVRLVGILPYFILNTSSLLSSLEELCRSCDFYSTKYAGNLVGMWREREVMPRDFYGKPSLYSFEDALFFGVEKYDEYLKSLYGDWRKLPPLEKQKSDHDFVFLDLNKPYK